MTKTAGQLTAHNERQRAYFERTLKQTMVPRDTPYLRRHVEELARFALLERDSRVLEVGCGMGRYTLLLAELGYRIEGLDLTPRLLEHLGATTRDRFSIPTYCADVLDAPAELHDEFAALIGFFALHHMHDLPATFAAMARLVRPGGYVTFLEPNPYNPLYYLQILLTPGMTWEGDRGIVDMRRSVLFAAIRDAGLVDPEIRRFGFFPPFVANRPWASPLERALERIPLWRVALPFQIIRCRRP